VLRCGMPRCARCAASVAPSTTKTTNRRGTRWSRHYFIILLLRGNLLISLKDHGGASSKLGRRQHPGVRRGAVGEPVHYGNRPSEEQSPSTTSRPPSRAWYATSPSLISGHRGDLTSAGRPGMCGMWK
jgi:hypothetical protein